MTVPGDVLVSRYRLVHRVATGGMGSVWEAWDELLERRVAIKELLPQPGLRRDEAATARSRVIREARITARLHHPHAVTLYDVVDHNGQPCLILQYVPSRTLNSILAEKGLLQVGFVIAVGAEVASALAAAHRVGIIHRDVKPGNVLITPAGSAMITDFGISHAAGDVSLTSTGMVTGTPAFLAPEVARGAPSGFPADVFSLGATLYAALEGSPPFGRDQNAMAILHKVASGEIVPPRRSGTLTPLLGQMLATDPATRPPMSTVAEILAGLRVQMSGAATAPEVAPQLQTVVVPPRTVREWPTDADRAGESAPAPVPGSASSPSLGPRPRNRRSSAVILVSLAVLVLAGVGAWLLIGRSGGAQTAALPAGSSPASTSAASSTSSPPTATSRPAVPAPVISSPPATTAPSTTAPSTTAPSTAAPSTTAPSTTAPSTTAPSTTAPAATTRKPTPSGPATSPPRSPTSSSATSTERSAPSAAQLAAAVTDYYALLPGDTDEGWSHLTSNFQTGIAQNRQYYQRFWDSVERVSATKAHGASPNTAEATITYHFKDGRTAVEPTVYTFVVQGGTLKIDDSAVLTSTTR